MTNDIRTRGVEDEWLSSNVVHAAERRAAGTVKVRNRDVILSREDLTRAQAATLLARHGVHIETDAREYVRDGGHQSGCRADHRVRTCGAAAHWHEPATVGEPREDGTRSFKCGGCGSYTLFDIPDASQKTGRKVMAHRAHIVARTVVRDGADTRNIWHPSLVRWRCPTCHAGHEDATVVLPADAPDTGPYGPTV